MSQYIKSHSNYVLKKFHQDISDGTVWERDITTIGGVNQFAPGQIPIYKSSNFIITVRNDGKVANQYNKTKWKENENSGNTWTMGSIENMVSESEDQNDIKIVLKQDFYDFIDFVYYGSLSEMFRASISDILARFPGELYGTDEQAYFTSSVTYDFEIIEDSIQLGDDDDKMVSNPFGINIHSAKKPIDGNPIKYFANEGFKNYVLITDNDNVQEEITEWNVVLYYFEFDKASGKYINYTYNSLSNTVTSVTSDIPYPCKGDKMGEVNINGRTITAWIGDNDNIVYLSKNMQGVHIRPNKKIIDGFYNECDSFEKIILNPDTTPRYKAMFSVIKSNDNGYYRELEEFVFPTSYGKYNIDASLFGFNDYTERLAEIGTYYDELFTDNLYRSMTHEAIKNFDWTFTREIYDDNSEEYIHGGEKIQKALRVFAREFDEILSYINNIKNVNKVTYDERNNIPDYFLIDEVEKNGWNTNVIYPYDLEEYLKEDSFSREEIDAYDENEQLNNKTNDGYFFERRFIQNASSEVVPYASRFLDHPNGYFIACYDCIDDDDETPCHYHISGDVYSYVYKDATGSGTTYYDACSNLDSKSKIKNVIKSYSNERKYTYYDVNNEFMRRMAINSPHIMRHKGTIEGIEMILGMFGLKSKRWVDRLPDNCTNRNTRFDYDIEEFSSFTNRIEDTWDAVHQMYRIDWINSTKTIVYDNRTISNYTANGTQPSYISYQGLPVIFREVENEDESLPKKRYLYPNFDKEEQLDGNPYFQMKGGWLAKTIENSDGKAYNFQFDVDDNITYTCYVKEGVDDENGVTDNNPIYKETIRNIKRVDTIEDLLSTPVDDIKSGTIYYVSDINKNSVIINGQVYPINYEYNSDNPSKPYMYVLFTKNDNYIQVGYDKFFDKNITVYAKNGERATYSLEDKEYGYDVKAYICEENNPKFICYSDEDNYYTIDSFAMLDEYISGETTNYFLINNPYFADRLALNENEDGWRVLKDTDPEYIRINTIVNDYKGNNPHNGNMVYDGGHEYFTYFTRLFKHAIDNELFDDRCYNLYYYDLDNEISKIGFNKTYCGRETLINDNELIKQYSKYLVNDTKIHYFGNYYPKGHMETDLVHYYGEDTVKMSELEKMYGKNNNTIRVSGYSINSDEMMIGGSPYSSQTGVVDDITNQVMNNKRLVINFYLHDKWHTKKGLCEVKYLDSVVMNYLTQMIPSTSIVEINYVSRE